MKGIPLDHVTWSITYLYVGKFYVFQQLPLWLIGKALAERAECPEFEPNGDPRFLLFLFFHFFFMF